jgi:hypothetical protein
MQTYYSPLSPEICEERIRAQIYQIGHPSQSAGKPLWGQVKEGTFSLRLSKGLRNPLAPYFQGTLEPVSGGTLVRGEFKVSQGFKIGIAVWAIVMTVSVCGMFVVIEGGLIALLAAMGEELRALDPELYRSTIVGLITTVPFMTVLGILLAVGLPLLFIVTRRGDPERIIEHLTEILDLEERTPPDQL